MKKFFALSIGVFALAFAACSKDEADSSSKWFRQPEVGSVSGTQATVVCATEFGEGVLTASNAGFAYAPLEGPDAGNYQIAADVAVNGNVVTCRLSGLKPLTLYMGYAFAQIGSEQMKSSPVAFQTTQGGDDPDPDPDPTPDPDPDPDPTPNPGLTKHAGWAELPAEIKNSDYHFAYHLCPDVYVPNTGNKQKRRNYGVCYSASLKCAIWVAAPMHDCYVAGDAGRGSYSSDPDIPVSQPGKWDGYTRGHMLGSGERQVSKQTNKQVFYHSNIAPQFGQPYFNTGGGAWNTLEEWVDTQWEGKADTTYQVIGSYWKSKNKVVNGTTIPTHYYKILLRTKGHQNKWVVNCSRNELQCIAVMVEHKTYSKSEVPQPAQYASKGMLYTVKQMEEMTGQVFFSNVPNAPKDSYNLSDWGL